MSSALGMIGGDLTEPRRDMVLFGIMPDWKFYAALACVVAFAIAVYGAIAWHVLAG